MKSVFYNAAKNVSTVGDGTVGDLVDWLEKYVNAVFPENGIEFFSDDRSVGSGDLKRFQKVPICDGSRDGIHHIACYVREGACEGHIIEIAFYLHNDTYKALCWMKSFGSPDECWLIARAIYEVLHSLLAWNECSLIVDMAEMLPRTYKSCRQTSLQEEVLVCATSNTLKVCTASGHLFADLSFAREGSNAHFHVEALVKDWVTVLTNMKARFRVQKERITGVRDLPGYLFTDRGVEECSGVYVLPPGGNPVDDRDYIGFFPDMERAIASARTHKESLGATLGTSIPVAMIQDGWS